MVQQKYKQTFFWNNKVFLSKIRMKECRNRTKSIFFLWKINIQCFLIWVFSYKCSYIISRLDRYLKSFELIIYDLFCWRLFHYNLCILLFDLHLVTQSISTVQSSVPVLEYSCSSVRNVRFEHKVGQIGLNRTNSRYFRSDVSTFWLGEPCGRQRNPGLEWLCSGVVKDRDHWYILARRETFRGLVKL